MRGADHAGSRCSGEAVSRRISRGRRAHLLALWGPRARAQEQREADRATSEGWIRGFNERHRGRYVARAGKPIRIVEFRSKAVRREDFAWWVKP